MEMPQVLSMHKRIRPLDRGVTVLEVLISIFVLLIGITGVIALFPVGVRLSQMGSDDIISAMTAQNALAAVRCQTGLLNRVKPFVDVDNPDGDVLGWTGTQSKGVEKVTGAVVNVGTDNPGFDRLGVSVSETDSRTLGTKELGSLNLEDPHHD